MGLNEQRSFASRVAVSLLYSGIGGLLAKLAFLGAILVVLKLISVAEFGVANIVLAIFGITESINELGLGVALVQRKDTSREEIDTLFWLSLGLSLIIYGLLFAAAPLIAWFYEQPSLTGLVRVYGLVLILFSAYFISRNLLIKEISFGKITIVDLASWGSAAALMILLALWGFGAWALILGGLCNRAVQLVLCQAFRPYWPRAVFRLGPIRDMVSFGLYATGSRLLYNFYINADYLIVGKVFGAAPLGIYTLAYRLVSDPVKALAALVNQVAYPAFARLQDELARLRRYFFTIARGALALIGVLLVVVAVYVDWALVLFDYHKWLPAVELARVFALVGVLRCVSPLIPQLLNAVGLARKNFHYSVATAVFMPIAFFVGSRFGLMGVVWAWVTAYPLVVGLLIRFGSQVLELSMPRFTVSLFAGLRVLIPTAAVAVGLRLALQGLFASRPLLAVVLALIGTLATGAGLALALERETIRTVRAQRQAAEGA